MAKDILLEIGTEEIPAHFIPGALKQLETIAQSKLTEQRIEYKELKVVGTPRRLVLIVRGTGELQSDKISENKGPSVKIAFDENGRYTKAAQGFARGQGLSPEKLVTKDGYVYAIIYEQGRNTAEILPELLSAVVTALNFPKSMRWANLDIRFARPIRWIAALFGDQIVPFTLAEVTAGNVTYGHRFLSKGPITVQSADDYLDKMAKHFVIVDQAARRTSIVEQIRQTAALQDGTADIDEELLEEVIYLVEYPTALCGHFEEKYLDLPPEAIITPMREHQRYFPVKNKNGHLLPLFITIRNGGSDHIGIVRHGNERVLRARLADARFFFEEDRKVPLSQRVERLKTIVFQEGLGTVYDKANRLQSLANFIGHQLGVSGSETAVIKRTAELAKADLVTGMVCEFTELQGVMGRKYALLSGESEAVAQGIFEHYLPRFAGDLLPQTISGRMISLADKIDNIVATFSRGLIPTGSQDPYALRRQALGIVNILIDAKYHLSLAITLHQACELLNIDQAQRDKLVSDIADFFRIRLKGVLGDRNIRYDVIEAVMAVGTDDVYDVWLRAEALESSKDNPDLLILTQAFTRAANLAKNAVQETVKSDLFVDASEKELYEVYREVHSQVATLVTDKSYGAIIGALAKLAAPIDQFFSSVMVMTEDLAVRNNRLALLKGITQLTAKFADISHIVG